ncbi:MAG TPA: bifunctional UDP-N-acetylglucosamine diphosphorylase/glucosamine-1-phosphate N-acetyltransferase GlmU [Candidatus Acidoferrales bacterium]|nr:bifunctional UDP-N-acetylglucosamine diphosphorylase/glucosamine-1-phosphate N-acetyltransferase GlmU [Candidatus Acidoferrales bacterium]
MGEIPLSTVILAAGLGTRMRSKRAKVLHPLAGRAMIDHLLATCTEAGLGEPIVVVSPRQGEVAAHLEGRCRLVLQPHPGGTGDALQQAAGLLPPEDLVLVLNADSPLVRAPTLELIVATQRQSNRAATMATVLDPGRRDGRVQRGPSGEFLRVVEHRDAATEALSSPEINVGIYCFEGRRLWPSLRGLKPNNAAHEIYLTDVLALLAPIETVLVDDAEEVIGINDRVQLARAERILARRLLERLMLGGVTVKDPASTWVDADVVVGQDTVLEPFTILRGATVIGEDCHIGPFADIGDCRLGDRVRVDHSWLRQSVIASDCDCGPFSKLRPQTSLDERVHVGSFAELVRSRIGRGSKVPHVSYLGDAEVGEGVNIGAGTITANYDGVNKNRTVIEDGAFIGVDTMLRAPVRIGRKAGTGAGSVVTRDVPAGATAVGMPARVLKRDGEGGVTRR